MFMSTHSSQLGKDFNELDLMNVPGCLFAATQSEIEILKKWISFRFPLPSEHSAEPSINPPLSWWPGFLLVRTFVLFSHLLHCPITLLYGFYGLLCTSGIFPASSRLNTNIRSAIDDEYACWLIAFVNYSWEESTDQLCDQYTRYWFYQLRCILKFEGSRLAECALVGAMTVQWYDSPCIQLEPGRNDKGRSHTSLQCLWSLP